MGGEVRLKEEYAHERERTSYAPLLLILDPTAARSPCLRGHPWLHHGLGTPARGEAPTHRTADRGYQGTNAGASACSTVRLTSGTPVRAHRRRICEREREGRDKGRRVRVRVGEGSFGTPPGTRWHRARERPGHGREKLQWMRSSGPDWWEERRGSHVFEHVDKNHRGAL